MRGWLERGGFLFVDDHNHDIDGAFHKSVTEEIARTVGPLVDVPNDARCTARSSRSPTVRPPRVTNSTAGATISCTSICVR